MIHAEGYLPEQVFNADETGLFWKRMPRRTFVTEETTSLPGMKQRKDRLTLLFCANASGTLKVKPLLVYCSLNPRAFKKHKVNKEDLGFFWRATRNAWVTRPIFVAWVNAVFGPAVRRYLEDNDLPLKALLLLDNAPAHPPGLEEDLKPENRFIRIQFLPPNTTPILQPMDQQVIANFKKLYTRELFRRCVQVTGCSRLTLQDFWKEHFDIVDALDMIKRAWDAVTQHNLNAAWRPLWPDSALPAAQAEGAPSQEEEDIDTVINDIVSMGRTVGLDLTDEDVEELVDSHEDKELSTQELLDLQELEEELEDDSSGGEEEEGRKKFTDLPTSALKELLHVHEVNQKYLAYLPNREATADLLAMDATSFIPALKAELRKRQQQQPLERWFKRQRTDPEPEPSCSTAVQQLPSSSSSS